MTTTAETVENLTKGVIGATKTVEAQPVLSGVDIWVRSYIEAISVCGGLMSHHRKSPPSSRDVPEGIRWQVPVEDEAHKIYEVAINGVMLLQHAPCPVAQSLEDV